MTEAEEVGRHLMGAGVHHVGNVPCASREKQREREGFDRANHITTDVGWEQIRCEASARSASCVERSIVSEEVAGIEGPIVDAPTRATI
jgi:hypothetical protein